MIWINDTKIQSFDLEESYSEIKTLASNPAFWDGGSIQFSGTQVR